MTDDRDSDLSFVRRWSRRKRAAIDPPRPDARDEGPPPTDPVAGGSDDDPTADAGAALAEAPESEGGMPGETAALHEGPTDADLPPIESLTPESDYSGFMSPRVSESLRRMALRKLFGSPAFNVRDGLDDYDDDFTQFQSLGDTVTADMKYHAERLRARAAERAEEAPLSDAPVEESAAADTAERVAGPGGEPDGAGGDDADAAASGDDNRPEDGRDHDEDGDHVA